MKIKKIYRTIIRFEILSEDPIVSLPSLTQIDEETKNGEWSGIFLGDEKRNEVLEGSIAIDAIKNQGSDISFFNIDNEGNEIEE
jgi:hypothetical protein